MDGLVEFVRTDPEADVLMVTNMWPEPDRPVYGIHVQRQVESLVRAGLHCDVLYVRGYRSALAYPLAAARFLWSSLAWRGRYRLVHAYSGETALAVRFHVGTPIVVSYCGDDLLGDRRADGSIPFASTVRARLLRLHAELLTRTITKSAEMDRVLPAGARRKNAIIPNGVDTELFHPRPLGEARAELGWKPEERVVLFSATKPHSPAKRLPLAERACALAASRIGPIRLEVVCELDPATVPLLMSAADCLLSTSAVEGSPNSVKEALMCNLPVIATPAGDIEELLEGVTPSWLCPPQEDALAAALADCLSERRRSNGREVAARLGEEAIVRQVLEVYEAACDA